MSEHLPPLDHHRGSSRGGSARPDDAILWLACDAPGATTRIRVAGEIDMSNAHLLVELVASLARRPPVTVEVDLSEVTFFCAHGISALLRARRLLADRGGRLTLRDPSSIVRRILGITDALSELEVVPALSWAGGSVPAARHAVGSGGSVTGTSHQTTLSGGLG
ncbi:STAS domain-containing protein [Micromonospora sp. AMSO31t]|uniref:STAS domain-containing protein n=1 Tax=Micromonospora sp. AMSO31t TaxID=2650566 RepID=UPI00124B5ADE|nr:STAS domain-containing protein [Micromonospora sp. AMSO31t]KAB1912094.1 STAS domain-containing protein [Micromonospora sp. AMSO31t]